jgi:hypothetical protein
MKHRALHRAVSALVAAIVVGSLGATGAAASTITVGSVLPEKPESTPFESVRTFFNTALPEKGVNLTSPVDGAIVRWRVLDAEGGPFYLRVLHATGTGAYSASGTSNPVTPSGPGLQTFAANLPIKTGDLIGIDPSHDTDKIGIAAVAGASFGQIFPPPFDGATVPASGITEGKEVELSAEVQPTPAIESLAPEYGPVAGGTAVKITGTDFNSASAVEFGETPAAGFTVDSDTQITATAPKSARVGAVDVTVTTIAGTSPVGRADRFYYEGCRAPKLKGKRLKAAKKALYRADCRLGKVQRRKVSNGKLRHKVIKQSPKPGKVLATGSKVRIVLGK